MHGHVRILQPSSSHWDALAPHLFTLAILRRAKPVVVGTL